VPPVILPLPGPSRRLHTPIYSLPVPAVSIHATLLSLPLNPLPSAHMSISPSFHRPRSLRLSISPPPAPRDYVNATSPPSTPSARREPWNYKSPSGERYDRICTVICLYDFISEDSDHLSFRRNEVLGIVTKLESGWWGAVRGDGSKVGWVPASYVHALSDDTAERPCTILEKTRVPDLGTDQESVTSTSLSSTQSGVTLDDDEPPDTTQVGVLSALDTFTVAEQCSLERCVRLPVTPVLYLVGPS
jgi:hypothetical protein